MQLAPGDKTLTEAVVVGYGTQQKKGLTGTIATAGARAIQRLTVSGFDQALKGQVAGLQITNTLGAPGGTTSVLVRGISSITGVTTRSLLSMGSRLTTRGLAIYSTPSIPTILSRLMC